MSFRMSSIPSRCSTTSGACCSDGGLLYVEAGDVFRVPETYGPDFLIHLQNEHCWYFTKDTLAALLSRSGFEVVREIEMGACVACVAKKGRTRGQGLAGNRGTPLDPARAKRTLLPDIAEKVASAPA